MSKYFLTPKKVKSSAGEAWFYADEKGIEIHSNAPGGQHLVFVIRRRQLAEYVKRCDDAGETAK